MKPKLGCCRSILPAFTLIELLVVIAIIGILAALSAAALVAGKRHAKIVLAKMQISNIQGALIRYESGSGKFPVSSGAESAAAANGGSFTYGGSFTDSTGASFVIGTPGYAANNSELMGVLTDIEKFSDGTPTINVGHVRNTTRENFLREQHVSGFNPSGIGDDGVYRDPWGNPYIISLNLQRDNHCADAFYRRQGVSQTMAGSMSGFDGLANNSGTVNSDAFELAEKVMVWSVGPDKRADTGMKANEGVNRDNVVGWR